MQAPLVHLPTFKSGSVSYVRRQVAQASRPAARGIANCQQSGKAAATLSLTGILQAWASCFRLDC